MILNQQNHQRRLVCCCLTALCNNKDDLRRPPLQYLFGLASPEHKVVGKFNNQLSLS